MRSGYWAGRTVPLRTTWKGPPSAETGFTTIEDKNRKTMQETKY